MDEGRVTCDDVGVCVISKEMYSIYVALLGIREIDSIQSLQNEMRRESSP